jgi:NitT/TauT family transport system substrate-binding protein
VLQWARNTLIYLAVLVAVIACFTTPARAPGTPNATPAALSTVAAPSTSLAAPVPTQPAAAVPPAPLSIETVRVAYNPQLPAAPILVGSEKGYFREQGIEIETERAENAAAVFQALASGEVDIGRGAIAAGTFNAFSRGVDVRIVATGHAEPPTGRTGNPVLVRKELWDSGAVRSVPDLRGRTVTINGPAGGGEYTLGSVLRDHGLTFDDVRVVYMPFPDMVAALGGGAVDAAASIIEPQATTALRRGFGALLVPAPRPGTQTTVIFYGTRFVADRPEVARRWMLAYVRALRDLSGEGWRQPEHLAILSRVTNLPVDLIEEAIAPYWDPDGRVNRDDLQAQQRFYQERGHLQYRDLLPIESMVDETWLDAAIRALGSAAR